MLSNNPVFIIGVPRSGTTLLRTLLDSHKDIAAPPEMPWITGTYGQGSLRELVEVLFNDPTKNILYLDGIEKKDIYKASKSFITEIFSGYLNKKEKKHLVIKTPDDIENLEFLLKTFPDSKYIHITRDGRAVVLSTLGKNEDFFKGDLKSYGDANLKNIIKRWYDWEQKAQDLITENNEINSVHVFYEDLVKDPGNVSNRLCQFLNIEYDNNMINYSEMPHEYPPWEAGSFDVKNQNSYNINNIDKWEMELERSDIRYIEKKYGDFLVKLGYELTSSSSSKNIIRKIINK